MKNLLFLCLCILMPKISIGQNTITMTDTLNIIQGKIEVPSTNDIGNIVKITVCDPMENYITHFYSNEDGQYQIELPTNKYYELKFEALRCHEHTEYFLLKKGEPLILNIKLKEKIPCRCLPDRNITPIDISTIDLTPLPKTRKARKIKSYF